MFEHNTNISRIVSLDLKADMSTEVEILCNQAECHFQHPEKMTVVKDKMYILRFSSGISVSKG